MREMWRQLAKHPLADQCATTGSSSLQPTLQAVALSER
jgi:hypothetical protein